MKKLIFFVFVSLAVGNLFGTQEQYALLKRIEKALADLRADQERVNFNDQYRIVDFDDPGADEAIDISGIKFIDEEAVLPEDMMFCDLDMDAKFFPNLYEINRDYWSLNKALLAYLKNVRFDIFSIQLKKEVLNFLSEMQEEIRLRSLLVP